MASSNPTPPAGLLQALARHAHRTDIAAGPPGQLFQSIAGTSMASAYASGVAALVKSVHPGWTAGQVSLVLLLSPRSRRQRKRTVRLHAGGPASSSTMAPAPMRLNRAVRPVLTFDVPAADYIAAWMYPDWPSLTRRASSRRVPTHRGAIATYWYGRTLATAQTFGGEHLDRPQEPHHGDVARWTVPGGRPEDRCRRRR